MVLEYLFPEQFLERNLRYVLLMSIVFSGVGIITATLLFGIKGGLISVIFTSMLAFPTMDKMIKKEELTELKERKFGLQHLYRDNKEIVLVYLTYFIGVFLTYIVYTFILGYIDPSVISAFKNNMLIGGGLGYAPFIWKDFTSIFVNNWWVLLATFSIALIAGNGVIFFITWNAASFGVIFSFTSIAAAQYAQTNPVLYLILLLFLSFPHTILEALAYVLAAISGTVISKAVIPKTKTIKKFIVHAGLYFIVFIFVFFILMKLIENVLLRYILYIPLTLYLLHRLAFTFKEEHHRKVVIYNYYLLIIAIISFILGVAIETFIIGNVPIITKIYSLSLLFGAAP